LLAMRRAHARINAERLAADGAHERGATGYCLVRWTGASPIVSLWNFANAVV
jgi:hypothetical protein